MNSATGRVLVVVVEAADLSASSGGQSSFGAAYFARTRLVRMKIVRTYWLCYGVFKQGGRLSIGPPLKQVKNRSLAS